MAEDKKGLSLKARKRLSILLLLVWLPGYIIGAVALMTWLPVLPKGVELLAYIFLGVAWALPFKAVFRGVGKEE